MTLEVPSNQSAAELRDLSQKLKMLGDPNRLAIMILLAKEESSVGDICDALKLAQPTASHHLGLLRMNGFLVAQRKGKAVIYSAVGGKSKGKNAIIQLPE